MTQYEVDDVHPEAAENISQHQGQMEEDDDEGYGPISIAKLEVSTLARTAAANARPSK